jgi:tryptophan synthase alpha chain
MRMAKEAKRKHQIPIVLLTYFNPVYKMGLKNFLALASASGVDGLVIPDLPLEEANDYKKIAEAEGIDTIFLAAPSTTTGRLHKILEYSSGFLYTVALFGVTGARREIQDSTIKLIKEFHPHTKDKIPLAVGFGISTPEHVRDIVVAGADGVIVGSAFVKVIEQNEGTISRAAGKLRAITYNLKMATRHKPRRP